MKSQGFGSNPDNINKNGRPKKGTAFTDILRALGEIKDYDKDGEKIERRIALAEIVWSQALYEKNEQFIKLIYDRIDGKPKQTMDANLTVQEIIIEEE